jgi:hypothetical protein
LARRRHRIADFSSQIAKQFRQVCFQSLVGKSTPANS